jgi:hypothetical protein
MSRRLPPVALVLAALLAQSRDRNELAFYLLVAAVPAAAVAALAAFGDLAERTSGRGARARLAVGLDVLALALIVLAAAVRGQAPQTGDVPALGASALVACLVVFAVQALAALLAAPPALPAPVRLRDEDARAELR